MTNTKGANDKDLSGHPLNLLNLLDYQQGAIVSRTIVDQKAGTVTLFAFDQGEGLSEHTAPFDALIYLLEGHALITISGEEHQLGPGEMLIMPANHRHAVRAASPLKMLLVMIR